MASILGRWFGYGLGSAVGKAIFGETSGEKSSGRQSPPVHTTEAEFKADEKRYAEDEKRLDEESRATEK